MCNNPEYQKVLLIYLFFNILLILILSIPLISFISTSTLFSTFLILVKCDFRRFQKCIIFTNLFTLLDIDFIIDNL